MEKLKLMKPAIEFRSEFLSMAEEFQATGEDRYPGILDLLRNDFPAYIRRLEDGDRGVGLKAGLSGD